MYQKKSSLTIAQFKKKLYLCNAFLKTEVPTVKTLLLRMTKAIAYHLFISRNAEYSSAEWVTA